MGFGVSFWCVLGSVDRYKYNNNFDSHRAALLTWFNFNPTMDK